MLKNKNADDVESYVTRLSKRELSLDNLPASIGAALKALNPRVATADSGASSA